MMVVMDVTKVQEASVTTAVATVGPVGVNMVIGAVLVAFIQALQRQQQHQLHPPGVWNSAWIFRALMMTVHTGQAE